MAALYLARRKTSVVFESRFRYTSRDLDEHEHTSDNVSSDGRPGMTIRPRLDMGVLRGVLFGCCALSLVAVVFVDESTTPTERDLDDYLTNRVWHAFRGDTAFIFQGILLLVTTVALALLCDRALRDHRAPGALTWSIALIPFVAALPMVVFRERVALDQLVTAANSLQSGSLLFRAWVFGPRLEETFELFELGAYGTRCGLFFVGIAGVLSIFSIDSVSLGPTRGLRDRSSAIAVLAGLAAVVANALGGALVRSRIIELSISDVFCMLGVLFVAIASVRVVAMMPRQDNATDVDQNIRILVISAIAFGMSAVFAEAAVAVKWVKLWVNVTGAEFVDFSRWAEVAVDLEIEARTRGALMLVYAACPLLVLAAPALFRYAVTCVVERQARPMFAAIAVALVLGSLHIWRFNADLAALATPFTLAEQKLAEHAIELPKGRGTIDGYDTWPMSALVRANGQIVDLHIPAGRYSTNYIAALKDGSPEVFVGADKKAPFDVALRKLKETYPTTRPLLVGLIASPINPSGRRPTSGLLGLVGSDLPAYQVLVQERLDEPLPLRFPLEDEDPWALVVLPDGDSARIAPVRRDRARHPIAIHRVSLPPKPIESVEEWLRVRGEIIEPIQALTDKSFGYHPMMIFAPKPGTSLGDVLAMVDRFPLRDEYIVLTADRNAIEDALPNASKW